MSLGSAIGGSLSAIGGTLTFIPEGVEPPDPPEGDPSLFAPPGGVSPADPGGWLWFTDRKAVYHEGEKRRTYFSYQDIGTEWNSIFISAYDHDTKVGYNYLLYPSGGVDDHNSAAIHVRQDGKLLVVYYNRSVRQLKTRISARPEDVTLWEDQVDLTSGTEHQYPTLCYLPAEERLYLFYIKGATSSRQLAYRTSDDDGDTWSSEESLFNFSGGWIYPKITTDGDGRIHFFMSNNHPEVGPTSLYHFYYEDDGWHQSDGTSMGSPSFTPDDATIVYDYTENSEQGWNWDIAVDSGGAPVVAYTTYPSTSDHRYNYGRWNGSEWVSYEVAEAGGPIDESGDDPYYTAGIALNPQNPSEIYLSLPGEDPDVWEIEHWSTSDYGQSWTVVNVLTSDSNVKNIRPLAVHGDGPIKVAWMSGSYSSYTTWDTEMWVWPGVEFELPDTVPPVTDDLLHHVDAVGLLNTVDTDQIPLWADKSPTGVDFTQSGSAQPLYASGRYGEDLPAVEIRANQRMASSAVTTSSGAWTEFIVVEVTGWGSGTNPGFWRSASNSKGNTFNIFQGKTGRPWVRWGGTNILSEPGPTILMDELQVITLRVTPGSNGNVTYRINGDTAYSINRSISNSSFAIQNFPWQNDVNESVVGFFGERLTFDRALSDAEVEEMEGYLFSKWGIDASHPAYGPLPVVEDFNDGTSGILDYQTGGVWDVVDDGDDGFELVATSGGENWRTFRTSTLYGSPNMLRISGRVMVPSKTNVIAALHFGGPTPQNGYQVMLYGWNGSLSNNSFQIRQDTAQSTIRSNPTIDANEWYRIEADWIPGVSITARLYDPSDVEIGSLFLATSSHSSGHVGFTTYGDGCRFDDLEIVEIMPSEDI